MHSAPTIQPGITHQLDRWRREGQDPLCLARIVADEIGRTGRHNLGNGSLTSLDVLHRRHHGRNSLLDAFLDAVLARRHDRFGNQTYLALPLVELVRHDLGLSAECMSALLMADVVRHERRPGNAARLNPRIRDTRVRHAARFVASVDRALDIRWLPGPWFALTVLPVSLEHDEYLFIRALQTHEMVFSTLTDELRDATQALREGDLATSTAHIERAGTVFGRATMLLRLVTTMRRASFHAFRRYTEDASAIQSEAYRRFELACGTPTAQRLDPEAFEARVDAPYVDNFSRAWRDLGPHGPVADELMRAVAGLESDHQRWRTTHHALAASMLGSARSSDYAEGVPYLRDCLANRLFDLGGADVVRPLRPMAA